MTTNHSGDWSGPQDDVTVQLLVSEEGDETVLASWLSQYYEVITGREVASAECYVVDERMAVKHRETLQARINKAHPEFLPVLLIQGSHSQDRLDISTGTSEQEIPLIADVINAPVNRPILKRRLRNLLVRREQSTELQSRVDRMKDRFQRLFEATDDAIFVLTTDGETIIEANPAATSLVDLGQAELAGADPSALFFSDDLEEFVTFIEEIETTGSARRETVACSTQDPDNRLVDLSGTALQADQYDQILLTARDVTEQTRRMHQVEVLNRVMRHDIRNKLTVIRGMFSEFLETEDASTEATVGIKEVDELLELSEKIRTFTSFLGDAQVDSSVPAETLLADVIQAVTAKHPEAEVKKGQIDSVKIPAYSGLHWAIAELVENAVVHTGTGQPVILDVDADADQIALRVHDRGEGMPTQDLKVIEAGKESPLEHASGIGLWLVKWIVERVSGTIDITSDDEGTTATITLPRESGKITEEIGTPADVMLGYHNRFERVFAESPDPIILTTDDWLITDANSQAQQLINRDLKELLGRSVVEIASKPAEFKARLANLDPDGSGRGEISLADDSECFIEYSATALPSGEIVLMLRDVTERHKRQATLRRLSKAIHEAGHAVYVTDTEGQIEYVNPAFEEITGYTAQEVTGKNPHILNSGEMPDSYYGDLWETILQGEVWEEEITNRDKSGDTYHAFQTIAPVTDDEGKIEAFVAIQSDITDRKEHKQELQRTLDLLDHTERLANVGGWEVDVETGTQCWTDGTYRIHDLSPDGNFEPTVEVGVKYFHPDDRETIERAIQHSMNTGEPYDEELRLITAEDRQRWIRTTGEPVRDDGKVVAVRGAISDITERKQHELELQKKGQRLEKTQSVADVGSWELDIETGKLTWSDQTYRIFGLPIEESMDYDTFLECIHPDDRKSVDEQWNNALETGDYDVEHRITVNGDIKWVREKAEIKFDEREPVEAIGSVQDITEQKERQHELRSHKRRFEVLFNNPISFMWVLQPDGTVITANDQALDFVETTTEAVRNELFWKTPWWCHSKSLQQKLQSWIDDASGGEEVRFKAEHFGPDGNPVIIDSVINPITDSEGEVSELLVACRDITERKVREEEIQELNERYQTLIEHSSDIISVIAEDGTLEYHTPAIEQVLGYDQDEILGDNVFEYVHPKDRQEVVDRFAEITQAPGASTERIEFRFQKADGSWIWLEAIGSNQMDTPVDGIVINSREITERKKRERELERYKKCLEESMDVIAVVNPDGTIGFQSRHSNNADFAPLGVEGETGFDYVHPEDRDEMMNLFATVLAEETPRVSAELRVETADEDWRWIEIHGVNKLDDPLIEGIIVSSRDITERKQHEQDLEHAKNRLQELQQQMEQALKTTNSYVWLWDLETDSIDRTPAIDAVFDLGTPPEEDKDAYLTHVHPDDRSALSDVIDTFKQEQEPYAIQYRIRTDDGWRWVESRGQLQADTDKPTDTAIGIVTDITDIKEREDQLRRERNRLDDFASIVSHDLRNPLTLAEGYLEIAQEECASDHLETVEYALGRMERLIDDLLTLARQGRVVSEFETVDLPSVLEEWWYQLETEEATLKLTDVPTVLADRERLQQAMSNLFQNAIKHGGKAVTVTVGELQDGFYVADDGPGIPPDRWEEVFEAGYSTTKDGTGVGLRIVKDIVEAHGWEIAITESEYGGARFEITGVKMIE